MRKLIYLDILAVFQKLNRIERSNRESKGSPIYLIVRSGKLLNQRETV